jgi:threonylcarbamoyladenosine tRNA methylthiotransferase MtaB
LGADLITGFPGETEQNHAETLAIVERLPFTYLHVFPYSVRPGTAAERLPDRVAPATSQQRAAQLRAVAERKASAYVASRDGGVADVVVIGSGHHREGMTGDYLTVIPADTSLPRGARFTGRLMVQADRVLALSPD